MSLHPERGPARAGRLREELRLIEDRKYSFKVHPDAHKTQIRQAVEELFDVKVVAREHAQGAAEAEAPRHVKGTRPGWKKAIVQLREGDTIEIFQGAQV